MSTGAPRRSQRIADRPKHPSKDKQKEKEAKHPSKHKQKAKETPPPASQTAEAQIRKVYLRINQQYLRILAESTSDDPNPVSLPPGTNGNLNVIAAPLADLVQFSGNTVNWLIRVARLIFEPCGSSSLFTFQSGSVEYWLGRASDHSWRRMADGDQLQPTIYEFRPNSGDVEPVRISLRQDRSLSTNIDGEQSTAFRAALLQRSNTCVITRSRVVLIASHLIPRRLGDSGVRSAFQRYTGSLDQVDRYHPSVGILLFTGVDAWVDAYSVGFWNVGPDQYHVHNFTDTTLNLYGSEPLNPNEELLHGRTITLTRNDLTIPNPPTGVFNWHYIQCVLKLFATPEYRSLSNIVYFVFPFRTRDDDDEIDIDFDDPRNIENPPYPSYGWDLAWSRYCERLEEEERHQHITAWSSDVS